MYFHINNLMIYTVHMSVLQPVQFMHGGSNPKSFKNCPYNITLVVTTEV